MENRLAYLVIEYLPHAMSSRKLVPARMDGHYLERADAQGVADLWVEDPFHPESRVVVVELLSEAKAPAHWIKRRGAA
jgi:hypothetical protein